MSQLLADWDAFISYAHEDHELARDIAEALEARGLKVWIDETALQIGDSLRRAIERGISASRFGIVILSQSFFAKNWPQTELSGMFALEQDGRKIILPVWHNISADDVRRHSPFLADRVAITSSQGVQRVATKLSTVIIPEDEQWRPHVLLWPAGIEVIVTPFHAHGAAYVIGKYPVTNAQYRHFPCKAGPVGKYFDAKVGKHGKWVSSFRPWNDSHFNNADQPVVCISFRDAHWYCQRLQSLLPNGQEVFIPPGSFWLSAAFADTKLRTTMRGWRTVQPAMHFKSTSPTRTIGAEDRSNLWNVIDMFGNVWEWCDEPQRFRATLALPAEETASVYGGGFLDDPERIHPRLVAEDLEDRRETRHTDLGFRIAGSVPFRALPPSVSRQVARTPETEFEIYW